jgi:hypothetical protein
MVDARSKHPLTVSASPIHLSPCPGEGNAALTTTPLPLGFLSPGQGERWHAKRDGEGVLRAAYLKTDGQQ